MPSVKLSSGTLMYYSIPTATDPLVALKKPQIDPSRPTILFIHALACDSRAWSEQVKDPVMNQNFNLICIDLPFAGLTRTPKDWQAGRKAITLPDVNGHLSNIKPFITLEQQADECLELIKELKLQQIHLVGCCVGTALCYYMIIKKPTMWKSALFLSPISLAEPQQNLVQFAEIWRSLLDPELEDDAEVLSGIHTLFFGLSDCGEQYKRQLKATLPTEEIKRYTLGQWWSSIIARPPIAVEQARKAFVMPICIASGTEHVTHRAAHPELEAILRSSSACPWYESHQLGNAPTMAAMTHPREVNRIICRFVAKCERRPLRVYDSHVTGYNVAWMEPYSALEERLTTIEDNEKYAAASKTPSKSGGFKLSGFTSAINRYSRA